MELIIDANILFTGLIKDSRTYDLIMHDEIILYAPEFLFDEYEKHKERLLEITHRSDEDFYRQVEILWRRIVLIPLEEIKPFLEAAAGISPDMGDVPYIALGLKLNIPIWSNDDDLKMKQQIVKVLKTEDVSKVFPENGKKDLSKRNEVLMKKAGSRPVGKPFKREKED